MPNLRKFIFQFLLVSTTVLPLFAEEKKAPPEEVVVSTENFIDRQQENISNVLSNTVGWFDQFFAPPHEEIETNDSFLRVIGNLSYINRQGLLFKPRFRLRVRVPGLKYRLRLIADGEDEEEEVDTRKSIKDAKTRPQTPPANSTRPRDTNRDRSVGLSFLGFEWVKSRIDFDVKVRSEFEPEGTCRFRHRTKWSKKTESRFTETGFWREKAGFGETTQFDLDRELSKKTRFSWNTAATHSEKTREGGGLEWSSGMTYGVLISSRIGINLNTFIQGPTQPHTVVNNYHTAIQYRQNILRPWFFYEIEPAVDFNRLAPRGYETVPSITFRVEVLFRKEPGEDESKQKESEAKKTKK